MPVFLMLVALMINTHFIMRVFYIFFRLLDGFHISYGATLAARIFQLLP